MVILPTTELTHQLTRLAEKLTKYTKIKIKSTVNDDDISRKISHQVLLTTCGMNSLLILLNLLNFK